MLSHLYFSWVLEVLHGELQGRTWQAFMEMLSLAKITKYQKKKSLAAALFTINLAQILVQDLNVI